MIPKVGGENDIKDSDKDDDISDQTPHNSAGGANAWKNKGSKQGSRRRRNGGGGMPSALALLFPGAPPATAIPFNRSTTATSPYSTKGLRGAQTTSGI